MNIRKISETWRQKKFRSSATEDGSGTRTSVENAGKSTVLRSSKRSIKSYEQKTSDETMLLGMSMADWNKTDSLLKDINILSKSVKKTPITKEQVHTRLRCKRASSTPLHAVGSEQKRVSPHNSKPKDLHDRTLNTKGSTNENCSDERLSICHWNLPESIANKYKKKGIQQMFPWQQDCLLTGSVLEGGNLVYSAPTSAGKTLVAEILMLKRVLEFKKKAIYILPFVSVAREKMYSLRDLFEEAGINVGGFMGSQVPPGGFNSVDIAVCTIEKANSLVNKLMEENKLSLLCSIVVDEMHMVGDPGRGYLLELLLTKVNFMSSKSVTDYQDKSSVQNLLQIICLSATLPNLSMFAKWLNADLYYTDYRPVPLTELIKTGNSLFDQNGQVISRLSADLGLVKGDEDGLVALCIETLQEGNSVLIFCPTKVWCEKLASTVAKFFYANPKYLKTKSHCLRTSEAAVYNDNDAIDDVVDQLRRSPAGLDQTLHDVVKSSVAFHHAGLTYDERDIIEGAFRRGVLRVLIATSTLSSGVNLPAKRVIIRSPMFHGKLLDSLVYKQMVGRAGRKGVDTSGESILVCKPNERQKSLSLLSSHLRPVYSCLLDVKNSGELKSMKRALLEIIAAGAAVTPNDIERYAKSTYLHTCLSVMKDCNAEEAIKSTMRFLLDHEFINIRTNKASDEECIAENIEKYYPTQLGSATLASSLSPDEALVVFGELQKARKCFVLENELHIIYQITPIFLQDQWPDLDWYTFFDIWERLPRQYKYVGELVGVKECYLARAVRNRVPTRSAEQIQSLRIHRRFYTALVLHDLVNEVPLPVLCQRYKINRGMLQSLQNSSSTFAGMVTVFCQKLGWTCLELLLEQFQSRLSFGVSRELCNLVRIPLLNGFKARVLYDGGYPTVSMVAYADKEDIARLLRDSAPFETKAEKLNSRSIRANSRFIWLIGKEGLTEYEAAELIVNEAKRILTADANSLGIPLKQIEQTIECSAGRKQSVTRKSSSAKKKSAKRRVDEKGKLRTNLLGDKVKSSGKTSPTGSNITTKNEDVEILKTCGNEMHFENGNEEKESPVNPGRTSSLSLFSDKSFELIEGSRSIDHSPVDLLYCNQGNRSNENLSNGFEMDGGAFGKTTMKDPPCNISPPFSDLSSDSMLLVSGSPLKSKNINEDFIPSPLDFSLRLSNSDEPSFVGVQVVPPLNLKDQFDNVSSQSQKHVDVNEKASEISISDSLLMSGDRIKMAAQLDDHTQNNVSDKFLIIDVASQRELFLTFMQEWRHQKRFSLSLACECLFKSSPKSIGQNLKRKKVALKKDSKYSLSNDDVVVVGVAICWGQNDAYYISLENICEIASDLDDSRLPPTVAVNLSLLFRLECIRSVLQRKLGDLQIVSFDIKEQMKLAFQVLDTLIPPCSIMDPKVAEWLIDPDDKPKTLHAMVKHYLSEDLKAIAVAVGGGFGTRGLGILPESRGTGRLRACVEAVLSYHLMDVLEKRLVADDLLQPFVEVEMPSIRTLAMLELNGIGFSDSQCEKLKDVLKRKLELLENDCYAIAKCTFSLASTDDVAKVLFHDLALPPNGDMEASLPPRRQTRNKGSVKHLSTSKAVLQKLTKYHCLPKLILEWRRVNSALTKVVYPLQRKKKKIKSLEMYRIFSESHFHTSTGRVTFSEPNIQNVPKEFDLEIPISNVKSDAPSSSENHKNGKVPGFESSGKWFSVIMRSTFIPYQTCLLLAADYSQLELRLIAHLANDQKLIRTLNGAGDVFKSIASEVNHVSVDQVTSFQRQNAKQICYGIIYGIGTKALSEQLNVDEDEAAQYMQQFKDKYSSIKTYINNTVHSARRNGFVRTLSGRKRYLKAINSTNVQAQSQAERQAVNTTVQGSAADLVKKAMNAIDQQIASQFGLSCMRSGQHGDGQRGGFLVLQLHDELIYEVNKQDINKLQKIIKYEMENAYKLKVKMPVKMRMGMDWGNLNEI